jgi:hypothetical protein
MGCRPLRVSVQVVAATLLALLLSSCHGSSVAAPAVRGPTQRERARIATSVSATWRYEATPPELVRSYFHIHLRRPPLRPRVLRVRVSTRDPKFATAVVELRDRQRRRRGNRALVVLERERGVGPGQWGYVIAGPALSFPLSCTAATPRALRDLLCPDPWRVLGYRRPRVRAQTTYSQPIPSPDLHALDWRKVTLPGGACASSRPIRPHRYEYGPDALIHADVDLLWWNPVLVGSWSKPVFGDLDGDGRDEAALSVSCANAGGTAAGQLLFSAVIFKAVGRSLRVVGIVTPRQPLVLGTTHVPVGYVAAIKRGKVVFSEGWYGPYDGDCCSSGRVRTIWTYTRGKLRPARTTILRHTWTSPLVVYAPVVGAEQELDESRLTRVLASKNLRFAVTVENLGDTTKGNLKVTLSIGARVETRTIERITPQQFHATLFFGHLGRLPLGKRTVVTVDVADRGTFPLRYPVIFRRG